MILLRESDSRGNSYRPTSKCDDNQRLDAILHFANTDLVDCWILFIENGGLSRGFGQP